MHTKFPEDHLFCFVLVIHFLKSNCYEKYMSIKNCLFQLLLLATSFGALGQTSQTQAFLPKILPGSPEAAGIARYGSIPVNMYTGVPSITIPLYEVQVGELKVPISLNYH